MFVCSRPTAVSTRIGVCSVLYALLDTTNERRLQSNRRQKILNPHQSLPFGCCVRTHILCMVQHSASAPKHMAQAPLPITMMSSSKEGPRRLVRWEHEQIQQQALREDRELEEIAKAQRLSQERENHRRMLRESGIEAKKTTRRKTAAAEQHSRRANMRYRGWLPCARQVKRAQLQGIKAERHHQYCLTHRMWVRWTSSAQRSIAAKIQCRKRQVRSSPYIVELYCYTTDATSSYGKKPFFLGLGIGAARRHCSLYRGFVPTDTPILFRYIGMIYR